MRSDVTRTGKGWKEDRNLIVYVSPDALYYLRSWGPDIETQMMDGQIEDRVDNQRLWHWLQG